MNKTEKALEFLEGRNATGISPAKRPEGIEIGAFAMGGHPCPTPRICPAPRSHKTDVLAMGGGPTHGPPPCGFCNITRQAL